MQYVNKKFVQYFFNILLCKNVCNILYKKMQYWQCWQKFIARPCIYCSTRLGFKYGSGAGHTCYCAQPGIPLLLISGWESQTMQHPFATRCSKLVFKSGLSAGGPCAGSRVPSVNFPWPAGLVYHCYGASWIIK